eukprot:3387800-Alexandrium_andersonii.AAC.1
MLAPWARLAGTLNAEPSVLADDIKAYIRRGEHEVQFEHVQRVIEVADMTFQYLRDMEARVATDKTVLLSTCLLYTSPSPRD